MLVALGSVVGLLVGGDDDPVASPSEAAIASEDATASEQPRVDDQRVGPESPRSTETGDLTAAEADAHRDLFLAIDASELAMIRLNGDLPSSAEGLSEGELGDVRDAAGARATELRGVRDRLTSFDDADSDAVATIRDVYLPHLDAWIDWAEAVAGDPTLLDRPDAAGPYFEAINFTARDFTSSVALNLDQDRAPDDVVELAEQIIERGFGDDDGTEI